MLISDQVNRAINEQIGSEFSASLQYVAIAAHFDRESLPELARHFYRQANEEREHALRFVRYVVDAGGRVEIPAVPGPQNRFASAEEACRKALDGEIEVTRQINTLADMAVKEADHLTQNILQWFINEQLEEVSSAETLLRMVQRAGEQGLLVVEDYLSRHQSLGEGDGAKDDG